MKISKLLLLVTTLLLAACAASGTPFQRITDIPKDKGVVYVYRPNSILGAAVHYDVHPGNDDVICDLIRNGYCIYYSKPGELELWGKTESRSSITVDVKAGQEHFVKGGLSLGFFVGRPNFTVVDNKTGLEEIAECVLLGKSVVETPAAATPVVATPVTATPVTATPVTATPVAAPPGSETPVVATPVEETSKCINNVEQNGERFWGQDCNFAISSTYLAILQSRPPGILWHAAPWILLRLDIREDDVKMVAGLTIVKVKAFP